MLGIAGIVITFVCVFLPYMLAGGKFGIILYALPFELTTIAGAAAGAYMLANKGKTGKALMKNFGKVFKGSKRKKDDYIQLLTLLFAIIKIIKTKGFVELEPQIEKPEESELFKKYPLVLHDHFAVTLICDTLRMMTMNMDNPYHVEDVIAFSLERHHHDAVHPAHSLQTVADGLPAIGIVAAVLGVIKTMASITEPPAALGAMIGGALAGTFLGVFMAYCFVAPMAGKMNEVAEEEGCFYDVIKKVFVTHLHGSAPQISIEVGRASIPHHLQPTFAEVETAQGSI